MRLISYVSNGSSSYGAVVGDSVLDLGQLIGDRAPDLKAALAGDLLPELRRFVAERPATLKLAGLTLLPVIPNPGQVFCVGLNYGDHVRETGRQVTESPAIFIRVPSSQVAHGEAILRPLESERLDFEGEIAVVIGTGGRRIPEQLAWNHIAGYSCYNDGSIRDWQLATSQWTPGKNFFRTGAFGPWLVTSDEIPPNHLMTLTTRLNGREMQRTTTDRMIHSIPRQIAFISAFTPLAPGDVIVTGTPGGVGNKRTPPIFMKPGDTVEVEVDAIGVLRNSIADDDSRSDR
ncbi:MAG: fumarylacetoacetate hydrolase family protein [Burkholderiales bacterium]|nr:fumarylacetoacetate hydrolase family protein [Burkholderiales bacterium]